jgi:uncharacterized membrane protein YhfC
VDGALKYDVLAGVDLGQFRAEWQKLLMVAVTEKRSAEEIDRLVYALGKTAQEPAVSTSTMSAGGPAAAPAGGPARG